MIDVDIFLDILELKGVQFYTGVPDSLLSGLCARIASRSHDRQHVVAANEGGAIALASGHYLATGRISCVYLQNSGLGNAINPLVSLADAAVYGIPMLLILGWRGQPGVEDEPQHRRQGEITLKLLDTLGIEHYVLPGETDEAEHTVAHALKVARDALSPVALVVRKGVFPSSRFSKPEETDVPGLVRERAIEHIVGSLLPTDVVVATTGMISRELYEIRRKREEGAKGDFLVVGSMGHASTIAAGIAMARRDRRVICLDGDGALLMHMGSLAVAGGLKMENFRHMVLNNGAHDSVGGLPTVGQRIAVEKIAIACGYKFALSVGTETSLRQALPGILNAGGASLLNVMIMPGGGRADLGRPQESPRDRKTRFMEFLRK